MQKILLLEDDVALGNGIRLALQGPQVQIVLCRTLAQAQDMIAQGSFDLMILDINLPDGSGLQLLEQVRKGSDVPVISRSTPKSAPPCTSLPTEDRICIRKR